MYLSLFYTNYFWCKECGAPLLYARKQFFDLSNNWFCSSGCKWDHIYREECSVPGKRPTIPGAWAWVCRQVFERDRHRCTRCNKEFEYYFSTGAEYDHILPIYRGGNSLPENVRLLCEDCHKRRHRHNPGIRRSHSKMEKYAEAVQKNLFSFEKDPF